MNASGDAAEQIVRMSLQGVEVAGKMSMDGAERLIKLILASMKDKEKTKGKASLNTMLKSKNEISQLSRIQSLDYKIMKRYIKRVIIRIDGSTTIVFINNATITINGGTKNADQFE